MDHLERVGRYETVRLLGRGGMGEVYLARDPLIDRLVAVKLLSAAFDAVARERFTREARAAGRLDHDNIVTVFDVGEHHERPFIAMEYVPGETLAALIRRDTLPSQADLLRLIEDACRGLAFAHRAGVVHLDVKPENLIRRDDGRLKILDFGIARVIETDETNTRHSMGTLRYMSPEQLTGGAVDRRSDVFGLGCVLYEVLSRRPAFGATMPEVLARLSGATAPPLAEVVPGLHPDLVRMTERAMAVDPDARYGDLEALREELAAVRAVLDDAVLQQAPTGPVPRFAAPAGTARLPAVALPGPPAPLPAAPIMAPTRSWRVAAAVVTAAVALGAGAWIWGPGAGPAAPVAAPETTTATTAPASSEAPAAATTPSPAVAAPANGAREFEAAVWQSVARRDRAATTAMLQRQPELAASLLAPLADSARTVAADARRAADARGRSARESAAYRAALDRVARAGRLGASGPSLESVAALWEAGDLFAQAVPASEAPRSAATQSLPTQPPAVTIPIAPTPGATAPPPFTTSDETPFRDLPRPAGAAPSDAPVTRPQPEPPPVPVETVERPAPAAAPDVAVRAALRAYAAAFEARDVAALRRIYPALADEQAQALTRTFDGATSYRMEMRVLDVTVGATAATASCELTHQLVPKVGTASTNTQRSTFHLTSSNGRWVIDGVQPARR